MHLVGISLLLLFFFTSLTATFTALQILLFILFLLFLFSVKIWLAYNEQLLKSMDANHSSFSLLKEVVRALLPINDI